MARKRNKHRAKSEMNVVPYIDVMLVLLVIFMISAPLLNQSVEVELPQSDNSEEIAEEDGETKAPFVISIDKNGAFYVDRAGDDPLPVTKSIVQQIASEELGNNPGLSMYIRADKAVNYGAVMMVMDILKSTGAKSVGLITETDE